MGFFSSFVRAATRFFRGGGIGGAVENISDSINLEEVQMQLSKYQELQARISEDFSYAEMADESYRALRYNKLDLVPAVGMYDPKGSDYFSQLNEMELKTSTYIAELEAKLAEAEMAMEVQGASFHFNNTMWETRREKLETELKNAATEIQTYLREETSDLEAAILWDSKFVKGVNEHIPPHLRKGEGTDAIMRDVMEAFRNWSSFAQSQIDLYGSQNLINAVYEAVEDGEDAMGYMSQILDINSRANQSIMFGGGELNENAGIQVPNAGFFGGGFFF